MKASKKQSKPQARGRSLDPVVGISVPSKCYACGKYKCKCGGKYGEW